jgi:hypothetical protein
LSNHSADAPLQLGKRAAPGVAPAQPVWHHSLGGLAAILLPGVYAWGATVGFPAFSAKTASPVAQVAAGCALIALCGGPWIARRWLRSGRAIGVLGFAGFSAAVWGALGDELRAPRLDPVRSALGALAWGLFALGWGNFPSRTRLPEDDPHALLVSRLPPRARIPLATQLGFGALLALSVALPSFAWRVERAGLALLAHALGLAASVSLLSVGSRVLFAPASAERERSSPRLWSWLLGLWLAAGALLWLI